jgi:hypothetical protein
LRAAGRGDGHGLEFDVGGVERNGSCRRA